MSARMGVADGAADDVCPCCGIWREHAGYLKESCGADFMRPGCFVTAERRSGATSTATEAVTPGFSAGGTEEGTP